MDGSSTFGRYHASDVGRPGDRAGTFRRRTLLAGLAGLLVMPSMSIPAFADEPAHYGRGYRGGYR